MRTLGVVTLLIGLYFVYKTFTVPNSRSGGKWIHFWGEDAGKLDCAIVAIILRTASFVVFWRM